MSQILEKFLSKINISGTVPVNLKTPCWFFEGYLDKDGYGIFRINKKMCRAHRISYELYKGKIPKGFLVCHKCDIPACVNPKHLFLGTDQDNANDKCRKNRLAPAVGSKHGNAKLTEQQVLKIRKLVSKRLYSQAEIAKRYKVSPLTISFLVRRITWGHV